MRSQGIIPTESPLASFHAVLIGNDYPLDVIRQRTMERLLGKIDKALQNVVANTLILTHLIV